MHYKTRAVPGTFLAVDTAFVRKVAMQRERHVFRLFAFTRVLLVTGRSAEPDADSRDHLGGHRIALEQIPRVPEAARFALHD